MKKYDLRRSLLRLVYTAPVIVIVFRLMRDHWPSWDLILYVAAICFLGDYLGDALQLWNDRAAERKRLARKEQLNQRLS